MRVSEPRAQGQARCGAARWGALLAALAGAGALRAAALPQQDEASPPAAEPSAPAAAAAASAPLQPQAPVRPPSAGEAAEALDLEARRAALQLLESDISAKLAELAALERTARERLQGEAPGRAAATGAPAANPSEDLRKLVALYEAMKPKQAALLLERLPLDVAASLLRAMKARSAGKILNEVPPGLGAQLSRRLSGQQP